MQVGYLGVGNMGQPMAGKLLDGGHGLLVYDISEAAMGERDQRRQRPQRGDADGDAERGAGSLVRLRRGAAYSDEGYRPRHRARGGTRPADVGLSGGASGL